MSRPVIPHETVIPMTTVPIKFGVGATEELGYELQRLQLEHVLIVTDRHLVALGLAERIQAIIEKAGVRTTLYDQVLCEPTDRSFAAAAAFAQETAPQGFVAFGGGSTIDTAKAMNLYATCPADILVYVNKPIGEGRPVPGPLKPLIALPTTAGTGSETTPTIALGIEALKLKTGMSHAYNRPTLAIVDPLNTITLPPFVTACTGLDVLSHAIESYTAIPYDERPAPATPADRAVYIGANPISDIWSVQAIIYGARYLRRAFFNGHALEARTYMLMASSFAGIGFGNAGVHIPHAMSYPIAGMARLYMPPDYDSDHPMIPHGLACVVALPAACRFTIPADPARHAEIARLMGGNTDGLSARQAADLLPGLVIQLMKDLNLPNGIGALGFTKADIPLLAEGAYKQQRLLKLSPRPVTQGDLEVLFADAMSYW